MRRYASTLRAARAICSTFSLTRPRPQEKDKLVADVMRYVLFKSHNSSGCPIKREELTGIITKNYRQRALPTLVINEARDRLAATFGYELRELQRTRASSTRAGRQSQPQQGKTFFFFFLLNFPLSFASVSVIIAAASRQAMTNEFCGKCA